MLFISTNICVVSKKFQIIADRHNFKQLHLPVNINPQNIYEPECGPMPNVMEAPPNIGGALCSMLQSLADAHY